MEDMYQASAVVEHLPKGHLVKRYGNRHGLVGKRTTLNEYTKSAYGYAQNAPTGSLLVLRLQQLECRAVSSRAYAKSIWQMLNEH